MRIPDVIFTYYDWSKKTFIKSCTAEFFADKRVVVFSVPGAFTPICSNFQLPAYERMYPELLENNIDEVYCISVNDGFVMDAWRETLGIASVKMIPDGNGDFTRSMGMQVEKSNLGFGYRSWRYAMVVDRGNIEQLFEEEGQVSNADTDPYTVSSPETVLQYLQSTTHNGGNSDE